MTQKPEQFSRGNTGAVADHCRYLLARLLEWRPPLVVGVPCQRKGLLFFAESISQWMGIIYLTPFR